MKYKIQKHDVRVCKWKELLCDVVIELTLKWLRGLPRDTNSVFRVFTTFECNFFHYIFCNFSHMWHQSCTWDKYLILSLTFHTRKWNNISETSNTSLPTFDSFCLITLYIIMLLRNRGTSRNRQVSDFTYSTN